MTTECHLSEGLQEITALPWPHLTYPVWVGQRRLVCSEVELTFAEAHAHVMLTQQVACVVREGARGPRGGRGKLHYNATPEWPGWPANKFNRYFAVIGPRAVEDEKRLDESTRKHADAAAQVTAASRDKMARLGLAYGMGAAAFQHAVQAASEWETTPRSPQPYGPAPKEHWKK